MAVCGEALIDLVDEGDGLFRAHPGGSPANVAVGVSRLGIPVALIARVSQDAFGRLVVALHSGSLALCIEPAASVITELLRSERARGQVTISLDPNVRPAFEDDQTAARRRGERQVGLADVVKASAEDLAWLAPDESPSHVARRWQEIGPKILIVTLGEAGALAVGPNGQEINRPSPPVELVVTVGAGDAFTAGLLAAMENVKRSSEPRIDPPWRRWVPRRWLLSSTRLRWSPRSRARGGALTLRRATRSRRMAGTDRRARTRPHRRSRAPLARAE
jgi:fructokinase